LPVPSSTRTQRDPPSTSTGTGPAGFTLPTPVAVDTLRVGPASSTVDFLGPARLGVDFDPEADPVPALGSGLLSLALLGYGAMLLTRSTRRTEQR
jgi:hypothetical protein